jgi:hypothetical protein
VIVETGPSAADKTTPGCRFCGEAHIGVHTDSALMLRGTYVFSEELGHELFVLDPDVKLVQFELPNGQPALVVDMDRPEIAAATHIDCIERILIDVGLEEADDEEEENDELDEEEDEDDGL